MIFLSVSGELPLYLHVSWVLCGVELIIYVFMVSEVICSICRCGGELWTHEKGDTWKHLTREVLRVHRKVFYVSLCMCRKCINEGIIW